MTHQGLDTTGMDRTIAMVRAMASDDLHPSIAEAITEPLAPVWQERLARVKETPVDRSVGYWVEQYLSLRQSEVKAGELSVSSFYLVRLCLEEFKDWCKPDMPIANLDANRWIEWYKAIQASDISISYKKKRWMYVRAWLSWLIERELITSFPSLYSRRYRFSTSDKEVKPLSVEQVREIVRDCKGILKLHVLLMLNCGMTQRDI
ncbi:MAG: hypothetical protein WB773_06940, partial [Isosphaeraceae bacterium]